MIASPAQASQNDLGAGHHALSGGLDEVGVAAGPSGYVGEAVVARVQADGVADDVGDRFDLDLCDSRRLGTIIRVQQRMGELVDQRLYGLGRSNVGAD